MTAQDIIDQHIGDWDSSKSLYLVSIDEFSTLLRELDVVPTQLNTSNGDGTYYHEIEFQGKRFCYSGRDKIGGRIP